MCKTIIGAGICMLIIIITDITSPVCYLLCYLQGVDNSIYGDIYSPTHSFSDIYTPTHSFTSASCDNEEDKEEEEEEEEEEEKKEIEDKKEQVPHHVVDIEEIQTTVDGDIETRRQRTLSKESK
jgi:hypothetical protein